MKIASSGQGPEIFASVQGEGRSLGRLSVFVRSSLCNLHCVWCDTDYTWNWKGTSFKHVRDSEPGYRKYDKRSEIIELEVADVAASVMRLRVLNVVLTGGEPLLHQGELARLMSLLRRRDKAYTFEVETSGTILPTGAFQRQITQYNVSPKLAHSGNSSKLRLRPDVLRFMARSPKAWFKFVCNSAEDVSEVDAIVKSYSIAPQRVYLMPQGTTSDQIRASAPALVASCMARGFNFSDRLHIHLFEARRGT